MTRVFCIPDNTCGTSWPSIYRPNFTYLHLSGDLTFLHLRYYIVALTVPVITHTVLGDRSRYLLRKSLVMEKHLEPNLCRPLRGRCVCLSASIWTYRQWLEVHLGLKCPRACQGEALRHAVEKFTNESVDRPYTSFRLTG